MEGISPHVEVRGVILAQVDPIGQHPLSARGLNQKVRSMGRGIVGVLLPLVGDGGIRTLRIGQQITDAGCFAAGNGDLGCIRVVGVLPGRRILSDEEPGRFRDGADAHRVQLNIGSSCGNAIRDFGDLTPHLQGRKLDGCALRSEYRDFEEPCHRQVLIVGLMGNSIGHQLGLRKITHILVHVGDDVKRIVARQALEMQCCGSLIAM